MAVTHPRAGPYLRSIAEFLSVHVVDEHAALDTRRAWPIFSRGIGNPDDRCRLLYIVDCIPSDGR